MKKIYSYILVASAFMLITCKNLDSNDPALRSTFIKFYEGPYSMSAAAVEKIPGGFAVLANMVSATPNSTLTQTILFETDERGLRVGNYHKYNNITGKSFKPFVNGESLSGFIIVGDSVIINPNVDQAANVSISSLAVLLLNSSYTETKRLYITDRQPLTAGHPVKDDYFGGAVTLTSNGEAVILGTFKKGIVNQQNAPEEQLLFGLTQSRDSAWLKTYPLLSNTYANAKSIHYSNGNIIWATAIADVQGNFTSSYLAIPFVQAQSVPVNFSQTGQTSTQLFLPSDIQPAYSPAFGYGVAGTYSEVTDGSRSNIFFVRVDANGTIIPGSDRYFDGIASFNNPNLNKNDSEIIDEGKAITHTSDGGFVIAGTMATTPQKGNGGKDLFLIRLNATGDIVWIKTMGGIGDEVPVGVTEANNGDIIVCGTNTLSGYSSVFLMRIDKNGDLTN
ncbi:MAG: hypothetical protein KIT62_12530 [Cyclobacteriaceae bacterium]|nr:hypothetical protein [Cyclobacteriaceae bacterium]